MSRTVVGRHLYAMGGNEAAARLSGIRTDQLKWLAYCLGAMTASIAGILYTAEVGTRRSASAGPRLRAERHRRGRGRRLQLARRRRPDLRHDAGRAVPASRDRRRGQDRQGRRPTTTKE